MNHVSELFPPVDAHGPNAKFHHFAEAFPVRSWNGDTVWRVMFCDEFLLDSEYPVDDTCLELRGRGFIGSLTIKRDGPAIRDVITVSIHATAIKRLETYSTNPHNTREWRLSRLSHGLYDLGDPWPKRFFQPVWYAKNELDWVWEYPDPLPEKKKTVIGQKFSRAIAYSLPDGEGGWLQFTRDGEIIPSPEDTHPGSFHRRRE